MNIFVYGDSNSWGYLDDGTGFRYERRWPEVMKQYLMGAVLLVRTVFQEGLWQMMTLKMGLI